MNGINAGVGITQVIASNNYWGSSTGPTHSTNSSGSGDVISDNVKYRPFYTDSGRTILSTSSIDSASFSPSSFFTSGVFSLPSGTTDQSSTSQINVDQQTTLNITAGGGISSVILPAGTAITKTNGGNIDSTLLSADNYSTSSLSGLGTGVVVDGAMQWGIPNIGLTFSSPISLSIYLGASFNGQLLNILRSTSASSDWTSDGISSPATCLVSAGLCSFQATKASYYATTHTISSSSSSSSSLSPAGGGGSAPVCNDAKPASAPTLLSAVSTGNNEVTLTWAEASEPLTYYLLSFGLSSGVLQYGNPNIGGKGITSYKVSGLSGGATYYFKVRAGNGCMPGDYSNEIAVIAGGPALSTNIPAGFAQNVLGVETTPTPSPTPESEVNTGNPQTLGVSEEVQPSFWDSKFGKYGVPVIVVLALISGFYIYKRRTS